MSKWLTVTALSALLLSSCSAAGEGRSTIADAVSGTKSHKQQLIHAEGTNVIDRIAVPKGYERVPVADGSYGHYLRNLPLKPHGSKVHLFNGELKAKEVYEAVLDVDVGERDLQQCADAVMRLRAEYLYGSGNYDKIHFNFTNGFKADYATWRKGNRIEVSGNKVSWTKRGSASNSYDVFRSYLYMVFAYAGTLSLSKEMKHVPISEMQAGDVFLEGGSPGHAIVVLDMAQNPKTGEKLFLLAQGYTPAQDIHILENMNNGEGNPWYTTAFEGKLNSPEWTFTREQLYRFTD
ncbi:DUF4846 domain-containing protein [Paenibacillus qinlingensis]|uniref:DUF4846 domain-containing protein n=1 Tax=Paenibacillus qinlingensis TaxID=1837343 RepID=UPI001565348A|nr:DUF4846 domain-containing protein [Paenibacillus qinlingensis]NQX58099.1 DUF4846 domain-containing protein [Paenibacillus qinlingensis]